MKHETHLTISAMKLKALQNPSEKLDHAIRKVVSQTKVTTFCGNNEELSLSLCNMYVNVLTPLKKEKWTAQNPSFCPFLF